jgi:undecaprenyl-diphosphatase
MNILGIIILAIVQGIAEFLPISSSAHLIIFRDVFGIGTMSENVALIFDIALHFGTLLAIVFYFWDDLKRIVGAGFKNPKSTNGKLFWYLIAATIPAGIVGVLFQDTVDTFFRTQYVWIAILLAVVGVIIYLCDKYSKSDKDMEHVTLKDALIIGCSQVLALMPGFSRSGTTIATSRLLHINKEDACKFSFYLSLPVVAGAALVSLMHKSNLVLIEQNIGMFALGILVSFVTGYITIGFLLKYIKNNDFKIFMWYRLLLAAIVLLVIFL